jgi:hypothetical protein
MGEKSPLKKRHAPLLLGYMRISTADGSQVLDRQRDILIAAGVAKIYSDTASGKKEDSQGLEACLKALRDGDTLVVCGLERLCRNSRHVVGDGGLTRSRRRPPLRQVRFDKLAEVAPVRLKLGMRTEFGKAGDKPHGSPTVWALDGGRHLVGGRHRGCHAVA